MKARPLIALVLAAAAVNACATSPLPPSGSADRRTYRCEPLRLSLALPPGWRAEWVAAPTAMLVARSPDGGSKATLTLDPTASTMGKPLAEAREYVERRGAIGQIKDLEGTVSGRKATGFRLATREGTFTVFAVDHDRGIYLLTMSCRTPEGQAQLDDLFARLAIDAGN